METDITLEIKDLMNAIICRLDEMTLFELRQTDMFTESLIA